MAQPVRHRVRHDRVASGVRPPRWTFPLCGPRVRMSIGMGVWVVAAVGLLAWDPARPVAWVPLLVVLSVAVSTLVHEGAHAWVAHNLGYRVEWVVLGGLAGVTAYFGRDDRPLERAAVAIAGPAASAGLVLGLVAVRTALDPSTVADLVELAIGLNVLAFVGNLLPVGDTDGAHLVQGLFQHRRQSRSPRPVDRPVGVSPDHGGTAVAVASSRQHQPGV